MASNLPSSYGSSPTQQQPQFAPPPSTEYKPQMPEMPKLPSGGSSLSTMIAAVALVLSLISIYGVFFMEHPLSASQKAEIKGISDDLRSLQQRDITMSVPVQTTIVLNKSYPMKDLFPSTFEIPLAFDLPIDTNLLAIGPNGQPFSAHIQENVPIKVSVPITSDTAFGTASITLQKELPVDAQFTSSVTIGNTYSQEMSGMIDKLDKLAG